MLIRPNLSPADNRRIQAMLYGNGGGDLRQQLLDGAALRLDNLTHSVIPVAGAVTPSMTRSTTATCVDSWGRQVTALAGELRFPGARRIENLILATEDLTNAAWTKINGGAGSAPVVTSGQTDPNGGSTAWRLQANRGGSAAGDYSVLRQSSARIGTGNLRTWYVKSNSGASQEIYLGAPAANQKVTVTTTWQRLSAPLLAGNSNFDIGSYGTAGNSTDSVDILLWHPQCENVTGQSVQTAGEYVSVGALNYRSTLNPLYLSLPGTNAHYVGTPDSVPAALLGDMTIIVDQAATDYTPAAVQVYVAKDGVSAGTRQILFYNTGAAGTLFFGVSDNGNNFTNRSATSSAATGITDGLRAKLKVTYVSATGKVNFYKSLDDGVTWSAIGVEQTFATTGAGFNTTQLLQIGDYNGTTGGLPFAGKIYSVKIYDDVTETNLVADYNPHRDATTPTGTITSSTTGEVWTLSGASSVVRSAAYHGSMVDGVKCFPTDLSGNPLPTRATFDAVSLAGVSGSYVSTPDSVAASITGDIDIRVKVAATDWTPSANATIITKDLDSGAAGSRAYGLYLLNTSGALVYQWSTDGSTLVSETSSATDGGAALTCGGVDGSALWVRVTHAVSGTVTFYTSSDGITWSQLGVPQSTSAGAIYDNAHSLRLGATGASGTVSPLSGKIYRAQIYSGINGTLVADFDASRYSGGGTTLTGSTGETWTLNGTAVIHPTNNPMTPPLIELAATNVLRYSNTFSSWASAGPPVISQNLTGPDGGTTAWTIGDDNGAGAEGVAADSIGNLTAAPWVASVYVKKTTGAQTGYPVFFLNTTGATTGMVAATIDTTNGVATVWTAYTGWTGVGGSAVCRQSEFTDWWRVEVTITATAASWQVQIYPAAAASPTKSSGAVETANQASHGFFGAQLELGSKATSYISVPSTSAITRSADQFYYTGALCGQIKTFVTRGFKREVGVSNVGTVVSVTDGTTNNYEQFVLSTATASTFQGGAGGVAQWTQATSNTYTPGTLSNAAWSAATNDIKMAKDGVAQTADTVATIPTVTRLEIGMVGGSFQLNGYPGKIYGWTRNLSQSEVNGVSA